jgi:hypothetical protein
MPYNDMLPTVHPDTGDSAVLIGAWFVPGQENTETGKKSWYLLRNENGAFALGEIWDTNDPLTNATYGLRGSRSIRPSPFPEDRGRVWYFCGFDQTGGAKGPAAWIYRGHLPALAPGAHALEIAAPSPGFVRLTVRAPEGAHCELESSQDLATWSPWRSVILNGGTWQTDIPLEPAMPRRFWRSRLIWSP